MTAELAVNQPPAAIARSQPDGLHIVYSDPGTQFPARKLRGSREERQAAGFDGWRRVRREQRGHEALPWLFPCNVLNSHKLRTAKSCNKRSIQ